jgi:hypothetical protein
MDEPKDRIAESGTEPEADHVADDLAIERMECALLSEASLAKDWNEAAEDDAWAYLQTV